MIPAVANGTKIVLMHKWNPERALELMEREHVATMSGVPSMTWQLLESPDFEKRNLRSSRRAFVRRSRGVSRTRAQDRGTLSRQVREPGLWGD